MSANRPMGPRVPPDKRNAAYQDIFARPGATHRSLAPHHQPYRQYQMTASGGMQPQPYALQQSSLVPPPSSHSRSTSNASSVRSSAPSIPHPEKPPDEPLTRTGLTPAQAYQRQVYLNDTQAHYRMRLDPSPSPSPIPIASVSNGASYHTSVEATPTAISKATTNNDRFGPDFTVESPRSSLDSDDNSELPWARPHRTVPPKQQLPPIIVPTRPVSDSAAPSSSARTASPFDAFNTSSPARSSLPPASPSTIAAQSPMQSSRRSSDVGRPLPPLTIGAKVKWERTPGERSTSLSTAASSTSTVVALGSPTSSRHPNLSALTVTGMDSPTSSRTVVAPKAPTVYPALLSRVAEAFRERIMLADRTKDGLTYKDAFDGRDAVDKISYIIKTTDRNLALLLGRALDAQKFFHDVTYDHRLRDSPAELYKFRMAVASPFSSGELANEENEGVERPPRPPPKSDVLRTGTSTDHVVPVRKESLNALTSEELVPLPTGVFTLLTDCYSPTCSRDRLCYSIACPRRLEQQSRLNMKPQPGLKKQISRESLGDLVEPGTLWVHSVPPEVVNSVSDTEKKRQEAINEVIYTERDFVRDMEYLQNSWINPLRDADIIPTERREDFIAQVFWNVHEIIDVNTRLRDTLNKRQKSYAVVEKIGDVLLQFVPRFAPFVRYGEHQLYGKYSFEDEKRQNPAFVAFVETTERLPESRKLELNGYLTKPTTRLARYPLLLEAVLKHTPDDNPDKEMLPKVIGLVREFLAEVNSKTGKAENRFNLLQLDQQLVFRPGEEVDLRLQEEGRELIYKGTLTKRGGQSDDLQVYLFDHALLMVKQKSKQERFKVYRRPIPLELLQIIAPDELAVNPTRSLGGKSRSLMRRNSLTKLAPTVPAVIPVKIDGKGFSVEFRQLGRNAFQITLWASTYVSQRKWVENIQRQQEMMRERSAIFKCVTLSEGFFVGGNKVNCAAPFAGSRRVVYGTDDGVYLSDLRHSTLDPVKVLNLPDVSQVDVLEGYQLLVVLSERQVITFPLDALDPNDPTAGLRRAKKISSHTTFFKAGVCLGRTLVCVVKSSPLSSTIKTLEPIDQNIRGRAKPTFKKLLQGGNDTLKPFREFYIPVESSSIHFLKTKLCVGCSRGFEIVDLESLDTQCLLDPSDGSLDFIKKKDNLRPMAIYRIDNEFLLCYDEFAFYVNKNGWRSRKDFMIHWEGSPTGFGLHYPYVLAFEPTFVEVRHVETGLLLQIIQANNLRLLFAEVPPVTAGNATHPSLHSAHRSHNQQGVPGQFAGNDFVGRIPYGQSPSHRGGLPNHHYSRSLHSHERNEILMVSDDCVVALRVTSRARVQDTSDTASRTWSPR